MLPKCCVIVICSFLCIWISDFCNKCCTNCEGNEASSRALVRSKRYLVFPEGSSLQLVFCLQTSALIPIGDVFLYGNTLALAWSLPTDPKLLQMFKEYQKTERRADDKNMYYVNGDGKILAKVPFKRTNINPVFTKRSVDKKMIFKEKLRTKIDREKMHERKLKRDFLKKDHLDYDSINFHRSSRVEIYEKLSTLISALGGDGLQCVLYKLCESTRITRQGTFLQELLRVIFTLPKGKNFEEDHKDYDDANKAIDDCVSLYPGCDIHIFSK